MVRRKGTRKKPIPYESREQIQVVRWMTMKGIDFFSVPNSVTDQNLMYGVRLRREGKKKGVPDLIIITPPPKHPKCVGTVLEMKRADLTEKAKKSCIGEEQLEWIKIFQSHNWKAVIGYGAEDAIQSLEELGY